LFFKTLIVSLTLTVDKIDRLARDTEVPGVQPERAKRYFTLVSVQVFTNGRRTHRVLLLASMQYVELKKDVKCFIDFSDPLEVLSFILSGSMV
jgi:hypothetical protein